MNLETVIGIEVHAELATDTKMFCGCPNQFGSPPNTQICPVCLGLPGSLPVINKKAVEFAIKIGLALNCQIAKACVFHRKNYFYPDMPKNFQISQYDQPICSDGWLNVEGGRVGIIRAHLEEDTGKSTHVGEGGRIHDATHSLIDYNRAGVPLIEIVSKPDIRGAAHARAYATELRNVLRALGVSDVKMEEGSMRCDANISIHEVGTAFGTKVEIKNMNSLRSLQRALEYEEARQRKILEAGGTVVQETRHWNEADNQTHSMRSKEEAFDYRYFPEPDLLPLAPPQQMIDELRASLPELPAQKRTRLAEEWGLSEQQIFTLTSVDGLLDIVADAVDKGSDPRVAANWATGDVLAKLKSDGVDADQSGLNGKKLAELCELVTDGTLSTKLAKQVLSSVMETGKHPRSIVQDEGLAQVSDIDQLARIVEQIIAAHPDEARRFRKGEEKLLGFFVGQAMRETRGMGNPQKLNELFRSKLS